MSTIGSIVDDYVSISSDFRERLRAVDERIKSDLNLDLKIEDDPEFDSKYDKWLNVREQEFSNKPNKLYHIAFKGISGGVCGVPDEVADLLNSLKQDSGLYFSDEFEELMSIIGVEIDKDDEDEEYHIENQFGAAEFGSYLGFGDESMGIRYHDEHLTHVDTFLDAMEDILPPFFIKHANIYNLLDKENMLFSWKKDHKHEQSEVFVFHIVDRTVSRVSNSLSNLLLRGLECLKAEVVQDIFNPSEKALEIIQRIDGDNVLPSESAIYELDDFESFPEEWKTMLTEEDYNFEL